MFKTGALREFYESQLEDSKSETGGGLRKI